MATPDAPILVVVDDDPAMNHLVAAYARLAGFTPRIALTGNAALAGARQPPRPALIVLDLMLPDLSGHDVCRRLKDDPATSSIPVLVLTAMHDEAHRARAKSCGAADYLTKPFPPDALLAAIRRTASVSNSG